MFAKAASHRIGNNSPNIPGAIGLPLTASWGGACGNGSRYVLTGRETGVTFRSVSLISTDARTWMAGIISTDTNLIPAGCTFGAGLFVASFSDQRPGTPIFNKTNKYATSTDGLTWTERTLPASDIWYDVAWNGTAFVMVGITGSLRSLDGLTWNSISGPRPGRKVTVGPGNVFVMLQANQVFRSTDNGASFVLSATFNTGNWVGLSGSASGFLAMSQSGGSDIWCYHSPTGTTWTQRILPAGVKAVGGADELTSNGTYFLAAQNGQISTTVDGTSWTVVNPFNVVSINAASSRNQPYVVDSNPIVLPPYSQAQDYLFTYPLIT